MGFMGMMSCGAEDTTEHLLLVDKDGPMCSEMRRDPMHGQTIDPVADIGNGWVAIHKSSWGDVQPFTSSTLDFVECSSGHGVRYRSSRVSPPLTEEELASYRAKEGDIYSVCETAMGSNQTVDKEYLMKLGRSLGLSARSSQATQMSRITECGCSLHYPETARSWGREVDK